MKYSALLRPHANSRYQAGAMALAEAELRVLLEKGGIQAEIVQEDTAGVDWLSFECDALDDRRKKLVTSCAHLFVLFEKNEGGLLPVSAKEAAYLGEDLPSVLKYKGKTNETFTAFMLNLALGASNFEADEKLTVLDPMCGRGTTLFTAVNRGWNAIGVDQDAAAVDEAWKYFKRYLEYHKVKHTKTEKSLTVGGKQAAVMQCFQFADTAEHFKAKEFKTLNMAALESTKLKSIYKKPCCHLIAVDLPYGVQHAPAGGKKMPSLEDMLYDVLPVWTDMLETGGAMALSFNVNTLKSEMVRGMMAEVGLDVMFGPGYDGLEHWVEQAITRDVAVAVRRF